MMRGVNFLDPVPMAMLISGALVGGCPGGTIVLADVSPESATRKRWRAIRRHKEGDGPLNTWVAG